MAMDQLYTDTLKELEQVKEERDAVIAQAAALREALAYIGEHSDTRITVIEELIADNLENVK